MLPLLLGIATVVWACRTRPEGPLRPAAAVGLVLIAAAAVGVVLLAAVAVTDPMTTWTLAALTGLGAVLHRFGRSRDGAQRS